MWGGLPHFPSRREGLVTTLLGGTAPPELGPRQLCSAGGEGETGAACPCGREAPASHRQWLSLRGRNVGCVTHMVAQRACETCAPGREDGGCTRARSHLLRSTPQGSTSRRGGRWACEPRESPPHALGQEAWARPDFAQSPAAPSTWRRTAPRDVPSLQAFGSEVPTPRPPPGRAGGREARGGGCPWRDTLPLPRVLVRVPPEEVLASGRSAS